MCGFERVIEEGKRPKLFINPSPNTKLRVDDNFLLLVPVEIATSIKGNAVRQLSEEHKAFARQRKQQMKVVVALSVSHQLTDHVQKTIEPKPECFIICGFSHKLAFMLDEFAAYVAPGSKAIVFPGMGASADFEKICQLVRIWNSSAS